VQAARKRTCAVIDGKIEGCFFFLLIPSIVLGYNFCIQPLGYDIKTQRGKIEG